MNADPEYRRFQFTIADLLGLMVIVAVLGGFSRLPSSLFHAIPLFAALYLAKYRILTLRVQPWLALVLYLAVVAALLPYLYWRILSLCLYDPVMREWREWDDPLAIWIGGPFAVFTVPTASFLFDTLMQKRPSAWFYALRSLVEVVILVPLWAIFWLVAILDINATQ